MRLSSRLEKLEQSSGGLVLLFVESIGEDEPEYIEAFAKGERLTRQPGESTSDFHDRAAALGRSIAVLEADCFDL
ncbi:hypothetical protein [Histidinibacterium aquaticum]|uniref:Uncharacterized protein n=1 Tax=Histidinibacterium aquaticum TaxID=2613962 RepID=A0A5J5GDC2_9RHOB|nr:hypothetical protein [Histidinibacterium aquaticum]KAA9005938.1 hypothetical protein F3S47_15375 [Histidinibacterium aquaticum]